MLLQIPKTLDTFPAPNNAIHNVFNEETDMWVITAYFTEPGIFLLLSVLQQMFILGISLKWYFQSISIHGDRSSKTTKRSKNRDHQITKNNWGTLVRKWWRKFVRVKKYVEFYIKQWFVSVYLFKEWFIGKSEDLWKLMKQCTY